MILLTRKAEFSAAHFYWVEAWSAERNERVFGKCSNRNGHGHNYTLEVTVAGEVDPVSGFVVDLKELKEILEREVVSVYDHRHLNFEVSEFKERQPTAENIAVSIWERLDGKIPGARLHRVRVYEMPDLFADFYGGA
jgi:6-pyruvoyltetrahydropterin/6-carboxytetrahydropterin synthase